MEIRQEIAARLKQRMIQAGEAEIAIIPKQMVFQRVRMLLQRDKSKAVEGRVA